MPVQGIGNILLNAGAINKEQLEFALTIQKNTSPGKG
jgi:hypothetical protein